MLRWESVPGASGYHVYRQTAPGLAVRAPHVGADAGRATTPTSRAENGATYTYVLRSLGPGNVPGAGLRAGSRPGPRRACSTPTSTSSPRRRSTTSGRRRTRRTASSKTAARRARRPASPPSGFGLSAITVGIDRGWITREEGRERVRTALDFFWTCPQSAAATNVCGYKGFFYHFLNMQTGHARRDDRALDDRHGAAARRRAPREGVLHRRPTPTRKQIRALADSIYYRVDWHWAAPRAPLVALGWRPESGYIGNDWNGYNEAMIVYLLGLGSPDAPARRTARGTRGRRLRQPVGHVLRLHLPLLPAALRPPVQPPLVRLPGHPGRVHARDGGSTTSRTPAAPRSPTGPTASPTPATIPNYSADEWGLTASDDPFGYRAHGAPPAQSDNGTITPTAPGGSHRLHAGGVARGAPHLLPRLPPPALGGLRPARRLQHPRELVRRRLPRHRPGADRDHDREPPHGGASGTPS